MRLVILALAGALAACTQPQMASHESAPPAPTAPCATAEQTTQIRDFYQNERPGVALPVASRRLSLPESIVASALPAEFALGTPMTPESLNQIWRSIDQWGADTDVKLVFAPGRMSTFAVPSKVPLTQPDEHDGLLNAFADGGQGVHAHLFATQVSAVYAVDLPGGGGDGRTRAVVFYDAEGNLIVGVYASIWYDPFDQRAADGFVRTWDVIAAMPRTCAEEE